MEKTFASFAFGCRVNQAEKEELDRQLLTAGFTYSQRKPSYYIINTCAVTQKAEREARQLIYQTKRKFPHTKIIATGCAATKWINEKAKIKSVDLLIDNVNKEYLAELIKSKVKSQKSKIQFKNKKYSPSTNDDKYLRSGRLFVKIQDGCQRFCTFCIVPYLRGRPKSRRIKSLVRQLADKDFENEIKEVILTAINTEAFGLDTGESFIDLISSIINQTRIPRISFGSIHPWSMNEEFFSFYKKILPQDRVVNYFHIPIQSGANKILSLMRRGYTKEEMMEKLKTLHKINPLAFIGTDIIVGFLEEGNRDFEETYNFLASSPISKFHIFRFSPREKTAAFYMEKRLKEPIPSLKIKRAKILAQLGRKKYEKFLARHVDLIFPALFLKKRLQDHQEALLDNQIPTFVKTSRNFTGDIKMVKIEKIKKGNLIGLLT